MGKTVKDLLWRIPLGVLAGLIGLYVFPTENIWVLAPLIPALTFLAVLGAGFWKAVFIGFVSGQVFYVSHIEWIALYLGPVPLFALSTLVSLYFALAAGIIAWVWKKIGRSDGSSLKMAILLAAIWTAREFGSGNFPYGGFPWSRLSMTQSESFISSWVWWGGMSLLSFVIALLGALLALAIKNWGAIPKLSFALVAIGLLLVPLITPIGLTTAQSGTKTIAAVQGDANAGLFSNVTPGTILKNHADATELVLEQEKEIDLLVWPENASDLDPLRYPEARAVIEEIAQEVDAPFTFGTVTKRADESFNSTILWLPETGPVDFYDKRQPVPFAEYAPDREFWRMFAPELVDMIPRGYSFGVRDGIYEIDDFMAGTLICFEIAEDWIIRDLTHSGAEVILSQTNNADFGYSDETFQQAGIARLRAIETGRTVVNISTVGQSAIYLPDGKVLSEVPWYTPSAMVEEVPLFTGLTPAMYVGTIFDWINLVVVLLVLIAIRLRRRV
jgi:apolipoprotein N-acyltransferase